MAGAALRFTSQHLGAPESQGSLPWGPVLYCCGQDKAKEQRFREERSCCCCFMWPALEGGTMICPWQGKLEPVVCTQRAARQCQAWIKEQIPL